MIKRLTGDKKVLQIKYLKEMDNNLKNKDKGWQDANGELAKKIAMLFD